VTAKRPVLAVALLAVAGGAVAAIGILFAMIMFGLARMDAGTIELDDSSTWVAVLSLVGGLLIGGGLGLFAVRLWRRGDPADQAG
jgi:hypothetical protein